MNDIELYDKLVESGIFTNFYKTKVCFEVMHVSSLYDLAGMTTTNTCKTIGLINHGNKYELSEYAYPNKIEYDFRKVANFSNYPDRNDYNFIEISKEIGCVENVDDEFKCVVCEDADEYSILSGDIVLNDFVILSKPRLISGKMYYGFYETLSGKEITLDEYREKFLGIQKPEFSYHCGDLGTSSDDKLDALIDDYKINNIKYDDINKFETINKYKNIENYNDYKDGYKYKNINNYER